MAVFTDIADAVVAELNNGAFSQEFSAERVYRPVLELADLKTLKLSVAPKALSIENLSRSTNQYDYAIDVAVQKKLAGVSASEIDPLLALVEEVANFFRLRRLEDCPLAIWAKTENDPIYVPEHLDDLRQFTSVLTLTYRVMQ